MIKELFPELIYNRSRNEMNLEVLNKVGEDELSGLVKAKIFNGKLEQSNLFPLRISKYLSINYSKEFIEAAMHQLHGDTYGNREPSEFITSSLNSVHSLAVLFLGIKKAKTMTSILGYMGKIELRIKLPSGNFWDYEVHDLFNSNFISFRYKNALDKTLDSNQIDALATEHLKPSVQRFFEYLQPFVDLAYKEKTDTEVIKKLELQLENVQYNFNQETIESLNNEIIENCMNVNSRTSFFYCIAGFQNRSYRETFSIEQFFCFETFESRFLIYKSELKKRSLFQCIENYRDDGSNSLTLLELNDFFTNLEKNYCELSCIGSTFPVFYKEGILSGLSLRYISSQFCPQKCVKHLILLIDQNLLFKSCFVNLDQTQIILNSIQNKVFFNDDSNHEQMNSLAPFRMIKYIATHHWDKMMPAILRVLPSELKVDKKLTSCITSVYAIASLLLGKDQLRLFACKQQMQYSSEWKLKLSCCKLSYKIKNLFNGCVMWELNQDKKNDYLIHKDKMQAVNLILPAYMEDFFSHNGPIIDELTYKIGKNIINQNEAVHELEEKICKYDYKFNRKVIDKLRGSVILSFYKVSENQSFFYSIVVKDARKVDHAIALEVYLSPLTGSPRIRLYQAWINKVDILHDMKRMGYQNGDEGTWGLPEFYEFIRNLQEVYEPNSNRTLESYLKCFGYADPLPSLVTLKEKKGVKIIDGLSMNFFSIPFSPQRCFQNVAEIIQKVNHDEVIEVLLGQILG